MRLIKGRSISSQDRILADTRLQRIFNQGPPQLSETEKTATEKERGKEQERNSKIESGKDSCRERQQVLVNSINIFIYFELHS